MKKIYIGISRHPKRFLLAIFFGYITLWSILEPLFSILELKTTGYNCYCLVAYFITSLLIAIITVFPKNKITFDLKNTNTKVEILFGNLFTSSGHKAIAANEYFDSEIGTPVAQKSVQGIFISNILGGHQNIFDTAVTTQLNSQHIAVENRKLHGKKLKYEIGKTIIINHNNSLYFIFALSHSDFNCNASSSPSDMLRALNGLWDSVRINGNGEDINLPLVGNGLSRIGLPPTQLLQLILISLLKSAKERDLSCTVRISLMQDVYDKIDLEIIKNNWQ